MLMPTKYHLSPEMSGTVCWVQCSHQQLSIMVHIYIISIVGVDDFCVCVCVCVCDLTTWFHNNILSLEWRKKKKLPQSGEFCLFSQICRGHNENRPTVVSTVSASSNNRCQPSGWHTDISMLKATLASMAKTLWLVTAQVYKGKNQTCSA